MWMGGTQGQILMRTDFPSWTWVPPLAMCIRAESGHTGCRSVSFHHTESKERFYVSERASAMRIMGSKADLDFPDAARQTSLLRAGVLWSFPRDMALLMKWLLGLELLLVGEVLLLLVVLQLLLLLLLLVGVVWKRSDWDWIQVLMQLLVVHVVRGDG